MSDEWLTYEQASERLGCTAQAVRQKAIRGRWQRSRGNDGKARVRLPEGSTDSVRTASVQASGKGVRTPSEQVNDRATVERLTRALEAHIATLQAEIAAERGNVESLRAEIAAERARGLKAIEDYRELVAEHDRRGNELAELKARPWYRRMFG